MRSTVRSHTTSTPADSNATPSFKMILTAVGDFAYTREDGIIVCPLGCLKP